MGPRHVVTSCAVTPLSAGKDVPHVRPNGSLVRQSFPLHLVPVLFFVTAAILPRELAVAIGGAVLFPYRLVLLGLIPFIAIRLLSRPFSLNIYDLLATIITFWFTIALIANEPFTIAIEAGVALSLDFALAYLLGRVSISCSEDFRHLFRALLPVLAAVALVQFFESVSHQQFLRPLFAEVLGQAPPIIHDEARFGLYRAAGPFQHPILGGVFMATMLPMAWLMSETILSRIVGLLIAFSMIFTVSASAILAFTVCAVLLALVWMQRETGWPLWMLAAIGAAIIVLLIVTLSDSGPLNFAARRLSISVQTGYWRVFIWEYAGAEALRNPLFGIGFGEWARPHWMLSSSIDAHFLFWSVRFGLIAGLGFLALVIGASLRLVSNSRHQTERARQVSLAIAIALSGFTAAGFSVAYWEGIAGWMTLLSGTAVSLGSRPPKVSSAVPWRNSRQRTEFAPSR